MRTRKLIRKFHRWIGLIASLWLLLLASTGFLLQHSHQWQLNKTYISNQLILKFYGIGSQFIAFKQHDHQLIQLDQQLIQDERVTIKLTESIHSAVYFKEDWVIATEKQILWIDNKGQMIQSMDDLDGLNLPIKNIGINNQEIIYSSQNKTYTLDSQRIEDDTVSHWPQPITNNTLKQKAINLTSKNYLSIEQFIFDIHAGITTPSLLNDTAAIALIILSLSGIYLFFRKRKRNSPTTKKIK